MEASGPCLGAGGRLTSRYSLHFSGWFERACHAVGNLELTIWPLRDGHEKPSAQLSSAVGPAVYMASQGEWGRSHERGGLAIAIMMNHVEAGSFGRMLQR